MQLSKEQDDKLSRWFSRIKRGKKALTKILNRTTNYVKAYNNESYGEYESSLTLNKINSNIKLKMSVYFADDNEITLKPRDPQSEQNTEILQESLRYIWRNHKMQREIEKAGLDMCLRGYGICKIGYEASSEEVVVRVPIANVQEFQKFGDIDKDTTDERVVFHEPWVIRIDPADCIIDPDCTDIRAARWIVHRFVRPLKDVQEDAHYDKYVASMLQASNMQERTKETQSMLIDGFQPEEDEQVILYECWDKDDGDIWVLAENNESSPLQKPFDNPYGFLPFYMMRGDNSPNRLYPMSGIESYFQIVEALNVLIEKQNDKIQRATTRILTDRAGSTPEEREAVTSNNVDFGVVEVSNVDNWKLFAPSALDNAALQHISYLENQIREISGISALQRGAAAGVRSATEATVIDKFLSLRERYERKGIRDFTTDIVMGIKDLMQMFWQQEKFIQITGEKGLEWRPVRNEDIKGNFDCVVQLGVDIQQSKEQSSQEIMNAMQIFSNPTMLQILASQGVVPNLKYLWGQVAKTFASLDIEQLFIDTPNEVQALQEQLAMMQQQGGNQDTSPVVPQAFGSSPGAAQGGI
ncbi:MAG: hypothetical protein WC505_07170 [Patescibacteria group bacterium]